MRLKSKNPGQTGDFAIPFGGNHKGGAPALFADQVRENSAVRTKILCRGKATTDRRGTLMLHNRYLPGWMHRAANAAVGVCIASVLTIGAIRLCGWPLWPLWIVLPVAFLGMVPDPKRWSLVDGCAGDLGYDELQADASRTDLENRDETIHAPLRPILNDQDRQDLAT